MKPGLLMFSLGYSDIIGEIACLRTGVIVSGKSGDSLIIKERFDTNYDA